MSVSDDPVPAEEPAPEGLPADPFDAVEGADEAAAAVEQDIDALDVLAATEKERDEYLDALRRALEHAIPASRPELVIYLAGADPWEGDRLGRLALTKAGLAARDELVLDAASDVSAAVCVCLAGGIAPGNAESVSIELPNAPHSAAPPLAGS